mgnify:CR=1 FL=1
MENFGDVLEILFKLIVLPIIPLVVLYAKTFIQLKIEELQEKIDNENVDKYLGLANDILQKVVTEVTQTYVDNLKSTNSFDKEAQKKAFNIVKEVRETSLIAECDIVGRSLRAQMKYADKIGAKYVVVLGDNEIESGVAKLKNMKSGEQTEIKLDDSFVDNFENVLMADAMAGDDFFSKL